MAKPNLLIIGDLGNGASTISKYAKEHGMKTMVADTIEQAIKVLCNERVGMAFANVDLNLTDFFTKYNESRLNTPVVVAGPASKVQNAVKAIRLGAIEYLTLPVEDAVLTELLKNLGGDEETPIFGDQKTQDLYKLGRKFASSNATVLLRGESGTGKEVMSRFIHNNSPRKDKPYISINCAAIPENLLESELFGHEKGAFSGAVTKRVGKFQQAHGGTLLLDEISEMDMALQSKLLRAIQERVIDPVGSTEPVEVDIRLIATTNRDLEEQVELGNFREDLYFRLNVVSLEIPALRERPGDIMPLTQRFLAIYGPQNGIEGEIKVTKDAEDKLTKCFWKGNVRELENTIHRAVLLMADGKLEAEHIHISAMSRDRATIHTANEAENTPPEQAPAPKKPANLGAAGAYAAAAGGYESGTGATRAPVGEMIGRTVQDVEKELILSTLDYCGGNRTHAADILGISIRTLRNKLKEYNETNADEPATANG